jgi:hypothetical protein
MKKNIHVDIKENNIISYSVLEINLKLAIISYTSFAKQNGMNWVTVSVLTSLDRAPVWSIQYYKIGIYCFPLSMQHLSFRLNVVTRRQ